MPISIAELAELPIYLFDVDGVLMDSFYSNHNGTQAWLKQHDSGLVLPEGWTRQVVMTTPVPQLVRKANTSFKLGITDFRAAEEAYVDALVDASQHATIYDHAMDLVRLLNDHGKRVGLVTGCTRREVQPHLDRMAAEYGGDFYQSLVTTDDVAGHAKPHPYGLMLSLRNLRVSPSEPFAMFGDSPSDVAFAHSPNYRGQAVFLETTRRARETSFGDREPDFVAADLADFYSLAAPFFADAK